MAKNMTEENLTLAANCKLHCFHNSCCDIEDDVDMFVWRCHNCLAATDQQKGPHNLQTPEVINESSVEINETPRLNLPTSNPQRSTHM